MLPRGQTGLNPTAPVAPAGSSHCNPVPCHLVSVRFLDQAAGTGLDRASIHLVQVREDIDLLL